VKDSVPGSTLDPANPPNMNRGAPRRRPDPCVDLVEGFLVPLVAGGEVRVGRPIDAAMLGRVVERVAQPTGTTAAMLQRCEARLSIARRNGIADLALQMPDVLLDEEAVTLAAVVHNLLFLSHPRARGGAGRRASAHALAVGTRALADLSALDADAPDFDARALARHSLLSPLFRLEREDIDVSFWAGSRRFEGARPPSRLTAWPTVRRVVERRERVSFSDLLVEEAVPLLDALLGVSPLTDLLTPTRKAPAFDFGRAMRWARRRRLLRAACHRLSADGLERMGGSLLLALERWVATNPVAARAGIDLSMHLGALECMAALRREPQSPAPVFERLSKGGTRLDEAGATFFGLAPAAVDAWHAEAWPPGMMTDSALAARAQRYLRDARVMAGAHIARAASLVATVARATATATATGSGPGSASSPLRNDGSAARLLSDA
jgi:hypothetical protein